MKRDLCPQTFDSLEVSKPRDLPLSGDFEEDISSSQPVFEDSGKAYPLILIQQRIVIVGRVTVIKACNICVNLSQILVFFLFHDSVQNYIDGRKLK